MITSDQFQWIIALLLGNIVTVLATAWKLSRYLIKFEIEHKLMWEDFSKKHEINIT